MTNEQIEDDKTYCEKTSHIASFGKVPVLSVLIFFIQFITVTPFIGFYWYLIFIFIQIVLMKKCQKLRITSPMHFFVYLRESKFHKRRPLAKRYQNYQRRLIRSIYKGTKNV